MACSSTGLPEIWELHSTKTSSVKSETWADELKLLSFLCTMRGLAFRVHCRVSRGEKRKEKDALLPEAEKSTSLSRYQNSLPHSLRNLLAARRPTADLV